MNLKELRNKSKEELVEMLKKQKADLTKLSQDIMSEKEKNVMKISLSRKDIARLSTLIREKELSSTS